MSSLTLLTLEKKQPETCCICDEKVKGFAWHEGGWEHMTCLDCVRKWTKESIDSPNCPICKTEINPRSILSEVEIQAAFGKKQIEGAVATVEQVERDEVLMRAQQQQANQELADADRRLAQHFQGGGGGPAIGGGDGGDDPDLAAAIAASLGLAQNGAPGLDRDDLDFAAAIAASLDPAQDVVQPVGERGRQAVRSPSACSMMTGVAALAAVAAVVIGLM